MDKNNIRSKTSLKNTLNIAAFSIILRHRFVELEANIEMLIHLCKDVIPLEYSILEKLVNHDRCTNDKVVVQGKDGEVVGGDSNHTAHTEKINVKKGEM